VDTVNAIAKVRFSTAKAQRIGLHKCPGQLAELLCMEAGQRLKVATGRWAYYVAMGTASMSAGGKTKQVPTGHFAAFASDEPHTVANATERRLVCLAVGSAL
jgi:quercetin dioxygenase-like cupin family protein